jgi:hypothetical protein
MMRNMMDTEMNEPKMSDSNNGYLDFPVMSEPNGRALQGQDGTTTDNNCYIAGDVNVCPATADFTFDGKIKRLTANLACPLNAVAQSDFRDASQKGLCSCLATLTDVEPSGATGVPTPLTCECFICPDQENQFGVAYTCQEAISGPCTTFNCAGICNGDLSFIDPSTRAPTAAPNDQGSAAVGVNSTPVVATTALLILTVFRMFR